jgi:5-methylcytosine-specific restriction endonuclease McrA
MCRHLNDERRHRFVRMILCGRPCVQCHYCGAWLGGYHQIVYPRMTLDHVVPLSVGGALGLRNIVPACLRCNRFRSNTPYGVFINAIMRGLVRWARP